jgi:elongation factor G
MEVGALQVSYREYLMRTVEIDYTHKKHTGPRPEFGRIKVRVVPRESGSGVQFVDEVKHGNIPAEFIPSVEKGMREVAQAGLVIGFPITDFEIHLMDGAYHDMDSSALAFEVTGRGAMREAALNAGVGVVEPIMRVEAVTQRDHLGRVIGALNGRGVEIQPAKTRDGAVAVVAMAPMRKLFGIEKELKESTDGETDVEIMWERYAPVDTSGTDPDDTFPAAAALCA